MDKATYAISALEKAQSRIKELEQAGEGMAVRLRSLRSFQDEATQDHRTWSVTIPAENIFQKEDAAALEKWESLK